LPGGSFIQADLYVPEERVLIEAKASADRNHIRFAIGQLFDYRRFVERGVRTAILLPRRPESNLRGLIRDPGIELV